MTEKEIQERLTCDPRLVTAGVLAHGPEMSLLGLGRHDKVLAGLMLAEGPQDFGDIRPAFGFEFDGRLAPRPIPDGVLSVRIYSRDGYAGAQLGISLETQKLPEEEYRVKLADLLLEGARAICTRAAKKRLKFDEKRFMDFMDRIVSAYRAMPLPLPATVDEVELAHQWLGVPREPSASREE